MNTRIYFLHLTDRVSLSTDKAAMIQRLASIQRTQRRRMRMSRLQPKALGRGRISIGEGGRRRR